MGRCAICASGRRQGQGLRRVKKEPTLLFCVGATKAGTSWLYDYLAAHDGCHIRTIKELHYFDTIETGMFKRQLRRRTQVVASLQDRMVTAGGARMAPLAVKLQDALDWRDVLAEGGENPQRYMDYLTKGHSGDKLIADISPSYGMLPATRLQKMAALAPDTRFVFLMRDPVARLWSHIRMLAQRVTKALDAVPDACFALLEQVLDGAQSGMTERGDYASTVQRLWAAVEPSKLKVMFMEDMLTPQGLARLCGFLGIGYEGAAFDRPVHVGPVLAMSPAQKDRARALLRPQYEFVARHYPDIPANWRKNMGEGL